MGYCHHCGSWQPLDEAAKLCAACWDAWPHRNTAGNPSTAEGAR